MTELSKEVEYRLTPDFTLSYKGIEQVDTVNRKDITENLVDKHTFVIVGGHRDGESFNVTEELYNEYGIEPIFVH